MIAACAGIEVGLDAGFVPKNKEGSISLVVIGEEERRCCLQGQFLTALVPMTSARHGSADLQAELRRDKKHDRQQCAAFMVMNIRIIIGIRSNASFCIRLQG
jgi:hypothetical protein